MMFSSNSFAEWTEVTENDLGILYMDLERVRKSDGGVYFWILIERFAPTEDGTLSTKAYKQGDCNLVRHRFLSFVHHEQPMGRDTGESNTNKNPEWKYPSPDSTWESVLQTVCSR